jgi:hypothetical protein
MTVALRDYNDGQLEGDTEQVVVELYRLRRQIQVSEFKQELRRDAATVRRALDQVFREIDRREGRTL